MWLSYNQTHQTTLDKSVMQWLPDASMQQNEEDASPEHHLMLKEKGRRVHYTDG